MFPRCFLTFLVCAIVSPIPAPAWANSYIGFVNQDGAPIRSGPGKKYYSTDVLRRGDQVEVHRIDEGGWCAIRPPAGSFCWVAEQHLKMTGEEGVAEVAGDNVLAYVGSRVRDARDVVQVRLQRGELVEVLGIDELPAPDGQRTQTWYRIAPPAGEFRWVHLEFVDRQKEARPEHAVAAADGAKVGEVSIAKGETGAETENGSEADEESTSENAVAATWKPLPKGTLKKRAVEDVARRSVEPRDGATAVSQRKPAATFRLDEPGTSGAPSAVAALRRHDATAGHDQAMAPTDNAPRLLGAVEASPLQHASATEAIREVGASRPVVAASATSDSESYADRFEQLDVEFSLMVTKPTTQWDLHPLMLRAQEIARSAQSPAVRERAHALLERMRRFDYVQKGTAPLGGVVVPTVAATQPPVAQPASYAVAPPAAAPGGLGSSSPTALPASGGLPKLLAALESLMPPGPPQTGGGSPAHGLSATPTATGVVPPAATGSVPPSVTGSVEPSVTAPASPDGLAWGGPNRTAAPGAPFVGPTAATSPGAGFSPVAGAMAPGNVSSTPAASAQSMNVFGRLAGAILYPLGSGQPNGPAATTDPNFDGQGRLMPLVSRKGGPAAGRQYVPPYVLTDQQGNIMQFVTPAPGVNLHRYVNQEIGVYGQRRTLEHLQQPHVTASRIVELDRHLR